MFIPIIVSTVFVLIAVLFLMMAYHSKETSPLMWGLLFLMIAGIPWMVYKENQEELANKETCEELGVVRDVVCTASMTTGKHSYGYSKCRVRLDDNSKHNLDQHLMALKGDKISYCTNSIKRFDYKNHYKVE